MTLDPLRLIEHVHGHVGWLSAVLLVHPAVVLRRPDRRAHFAVALATALVTLAAALGAWLYVAYTERLRQPIYEASRATGLLMERKEHLAFAAVLLAWAGAAAYFATPRADGELAVTLRTIARRAFTASALLALGVAALGTVVAVYRSF